MVKSLSNNKQKLTREGTHTWVIYHDFCRSEEEQSHINHILKANEEFAQLEMIKEGMLEFFNAQSEIEALDLFLTIGLMRPS